MRIEGRARGRPAAPVRVWREGTELDAEDAEALFMPRRPGEGAGSKIGLFVARGVAEAQGGRAWAEVDGRARCRSTSSSPRSTRAEQGRLLDSAA